MPLRLLIAVSALCCLFLSRSDAAIVDLATYPGLDPSNARQGSRSHLGAIGPISYIAGKKLGPPGGVRWRGFLIFNLSNLTTPVAAAEFRTIQGVAFTPDTETVNIFDVTASPAELQSTTSNVSVYDDLGTGQMYGSLVGFADGADFSSIYSTQLGPAAVAAINANLGGYFAVGLALDSIDTATNQEEIVFQSTSSSPILRVTLIPEPELLSIILGGSFGLLLICGHRSVLSRRFPSVISASIQP